jgi:hypothetical protein
LQNCQTAHHLLDLSLTNAADKPSLDPNDIVHRIGTVWEPVRHAGTLVILCSPHQHARVQAKGGRWIDLLQYSHCRIASLPVFSRRQGNSNRQETRNFISHWHGTRMHCFVSGIPYTTRRVIQDTTRYASHPPRTALSLCRWWTSHVKNRQNHICHART